MSAFDDKREDIVMTEVLRELLTICGFDTVLSADIYYSISLKIKGRIKVFLSGAALESFCSKLISDEIVARLTDSDKIYDFFVDGGDLSPIGQTLLNGLYMILDNSVENGYLDRESADNTFDAIDEMFDKVSNIVKESSIEGLKKAEWFFNDMERFFNDNPENSAYVQSNKDEKNVHPKKENYYSDGVIGCVFLLAAPFIIMFILAILVTFLS